MAVVEVFGLDPELGFVGEWLSSPKWLRIV